VADNVDPFTVALLDPSPEKDHLGESTPLTVRCERGNWWAFDDVESRVCDNVAQLGGSKCTEISARESVSRIRKANAMNDEMHAFQEPTLKLFEWNIAANLSHVDSAARGNVLVPSTALRSRVIDPRKNVS
jgi:hypothetical protein